MKGTRAIPVEGKGDNDSAKVRRPPAGVQLLEELDKLMGVAQATRSLLCDKLSPIMVENKYSESVAAESEVDPDLPPFFRATKSKLECLEAELDGMRQIIDSVNLT